MSDVIANFELIARQEGQASFPMRIEICRPEPSSKMAPAWQCSVSVTPLWNRPFLIYGEGSFQTLCLGAKHALQMLDTFMAQGGTLMHSDGSEFETESFGFKLLARE